MSFPTALASALQGTLFVDIPRETSRSSVALLCSPSGELLMIRRAHREGDYWSGHMGFPGGREEHRDEDLLATSIRETAEELSIDLEEEAELLGRLEDLTHPKLSVSAFVFLQTKELSPCPNHEVAKIHWIPLNAFEDSGNWSEHNVPYKGLVRKLPIVWVGEADIWGISLHFIEQLRGLISAGIMGNVDPLAQVSTHPGQLL